MLIFVLLVILALGVWIGLRLWAQENGFYPALFAPIGISVIIDLLIFYVVEILK